MIRKVKGTRDVLPPDSRLWVEVEKTAHRVFGGFGYEEIRLPIMEPTELFVRSVGEDTDIVAKEMYTFSDRKGKKDAKVGVSRRFSDELQQPIHAIRLWQTNGCIAPLAVPRYSGLQVPSGRRDLLGSGVVPRQETAEPRPCGSRLDGLSLTRPCE